MDTNISLDGDPKLLYKAIRRHTDKLGPFFGELLECHQLSGSILFSVSLFSFCLALTLSLINGKIQKKYKKVYFENKTTNQKLVTDGIETSAHCD